MDKGNMKWLMLIALVLIVFGMKGTLPKEAVKDVNGIACTKDADCPCWGNYVNPYTHINESAYGIGQSQCLNCALADNRNMTGCVGHSDYRCDATWCFDVKPVGDWTRDNPWQWLKDNPMVAVGIVALLLLLIFYPKQ